MLNWHDANLPELQPAINLITANLVREGRIDQAFQLFGLTRNSEERDEGGFIFNRHFRLDPSGNLFDWQFPRLRGVGFSIDGNSPSNASDDGRNPIGEWKFGSKMRRYD